MCVYGVLVHLLVLLVTALHVRLVELEAIQICTMQAAATGGDAATVAAVPSESKCVAANRLFYFAIPPSIYAEVALAVNPHAMSSTGTIVTLVT